MSEKKSRRIPKYRHYKPKDLAVVRIDGRDHYLGKYDSPVSHERYDRLIAEWLSNGRLTIRSQSENGLSSHQSPCVGDVILAYWEHAKSYYRKNVEPTGEHDNIRYALKPVRRLFESAPAVTERPKPATERRLKTGHF